MVRLKDLRIKSGLTIEAEGIWNMNEDTHSSVVWQDLLKNNASDKLLPHVETGTAERMGGVL